MSDCLAPYPREQRVALLPSRRAPDAGGLPRGSADETMSRGNSIGEEVIAAIYALCEPSQRPLYG